MGLGLNGGGEASVRFFLQHGAYVTVTDMKNKDQLRKTIDSLTNDPRVDKSRLRYVLGHHDKVDFAEADCVIKNPGVKYEGNEYLAAAKVIETDISIFLHFTKAPIIAITGSKGKSSTASAIKYGLNGAKICSFLGGNITVSPLTFLDRTDKTTPVVLELSSWQLADLRGRKALKPYVAIITKIVPDHQNFYHSMETYVADKRLIYADQTKNDFTIIDADGDEPGTGPEKGGTWGDLFASETGGTILRYSRNPLPDTVFGAWQEKLQNGNFRGVARLPRYLLSQDAKNNYDDTETILGELSVPGTHMRTNVLNAALVMRIMGIQPSETIRILSGWTGIPHRLQYFHVWNCNGTSVKFYNDSCSTVPEATAAASQAFGKPVILLCGGTDKGLSQEPLANTLACLNGEIPVSALYLLKGTATDILMPLLRKKDIRYRGPFDSLTAMLEQVKTDLQTTIPVKQSEIAVVFSPGSTSFGMFMNEFDRGNKFMEEAKKIF